MESRADEIERDFRAAVGHDEHGQAALACTLNVEAFCCIGQEVFPADVFDLFVILLIDPGIAATDASTSIVCLFDSCWPQLDPSQRQRLWAAFETAYPLLTNAQSRFLISAIACERLSTEESQNLLCRIWKSLDPALRSNMRDNLESTASMNGDAAARQAAQSVLIRLRQEPGWNNGG